MLKEKAFTESVENGLEELDSENVFNPLGK